MSPDPRWAQLAAAAREATSGPWRADGDSVIGPNGVDVADALVGYAGDARYISLASPDAVLALVAEHAAAVAENTRLRAVAEAAGALDRVATWSALGRPEVEPLRTALAALEPVGDLDYMCPNCVTPWKCNGPHIPEPR